MTDNTEDEPLDDLSNTHSVNHSDEIIPTSNTDAVKSNQETENMEVHHHPDLHHKPKKWKEYFLEFLMIFLAVTMGFIAENVREHFVEKRHEKGYMLSLLRDLEHDTTGINIAVPVNMEASYFYRCLHIRKLL